MAEKVIRGIQQVGIGVRDVDEAWKWYRKAFGVDIKIFGDEAVADSMLPYTGGEPRKRNAVLAINLQGGGGFEIWQYKCREPLAPSFNIQLGDLGIFAAKVKCRDVRLTHKHYEENKYDITKILKDPNGNEYFFVTDPFGNIFQLVSSTSWFQKLDYHTGGTYGAIIGVSDIEKAKNLYGGILNYTEVVYQEEGYFEDLSVLSGGAQKFKRVLLNITEKSVGGFSKMFGASQIELVQVLDRKPMKIFEGRFWGDLGFIHLCYDIYDMDALKNECKEKGYPFTVDSFENHGESFDIGEAAGHFSYIEDDDGTLIEFVETHKIPILKKLGIYLNLRKRDPNKNLPDWIIKALRFGRIKN